MEMQHINIAEPTKDEKQAQRGCITAGKKKSRPSGRFSFSKGGLEESDGQRE